MKPDAVILIGLGAPADFSEAAARDFIFEFLRDPDVLRLPFFLRRFIAWKVSKKRARAYSQKLSELAGNGEMQTAHYGKSIAQKLEKKISIPVRYAGVYGRENIARAVQDLKPQKNILFIPLYPQYSSATVLPAVKKIRGLGFGGSAIAETYFDIPEYIGALAKSVRPHIEKIDFLLGAFHSMPESAPDVGEYAHECAETMGALADYFPGLGCSVSWQSAMGRGKWLQPSADETARALALRGIKRLGVISPGFFCECAETSVDIDKDLRKSFLASGGESFVYIKCLNDDEAQLALLEKICLTHDIS